MYFFGFPYLVHDVRLRDGEGGDPGEDDEGGGVEPGPDVRQAPQAQTKLNEAINNNKKRWRFIECQI